VPSKDPSQAHKHSANHREEILDSSYCGCFYCLAMYSPRRIKEWTDDGKTAVCPECGTDAVLGSASGYPIEEEFLRKLNLLWF
jgi:hypothetical protein